MSNFSYQIHISPPKNTPCHKISVRHVNFSKTDSIDIIDVHFTFVNDVYKNHPYGMPKLRFHDLRHSCASLLFAQGISLKGIQAWLGHSAIGTTANIDTHLDENSKINSANAILSILPQ